VSSDKQLLIRSKTPLGGVLFLVPAQCEVVSAPLEAQLNQIIFIGS